MENCHVCPIGFQTTDEGSLTCLVLLDYSKVFDTLDQEIRCKNLRFFGFSSEGVCLIENDLLNGRQKIILDGIVSEDLRLSRGVSPGSIFVVYFLHYVSVTYISMSVNAKYFITQMISNSTYPLNFKTLNLVNLKST